MAEFWHKVGGAILFYNLHYEKFANGTVKCIEDEIPFELPEGWAWTRIGSIATVKGGKRVPKGMTFSSEPTQHAYVRVTDMKNHTVNLSDLKYIDETVFAEIKNYTIAKNDLYITIAGTIGAVGEFPDELDGMNLTENAVKVTAITLNKTFLCLMMQTEYVQKQFKHKTYQVAMPKLGLERILTTLIPICSLSTQNKICKAVNDASIYIDIISENYQGLSDTITITKSKILDLAIRGKLVPQDPSGEPASVLLERIRIEKEELIKAGKIKRDKKESVIFKGEDNSYYEKIGNETHCIDAEVPFDLPTEWVWCRGYSCFSGVETRRPNGDSFKYIDIDSIDNKAHKIKQPKVIATKDAPSRASRALHAGSVLFSFVRPYLENIAYVTEDNKDCIASTGFYVCNSNGMLYPPFMYYLMISQYVVNGLNQFMKGDNSPSISKDNIENWLYPIPPFNEQKLICTKLEELISFISTIEKSLS